VARTRPNPRGPRLPSLTESQSAFQHVPRFVVAAMKMRRGRSDWRTWRTAWVAPLGDHKRIGDRTHDLPSSEEQFSSNSIGRASSKKIKRGYT